jgi:UDPglucose--hexose-1-phosphate uridylyltransferase|tara:strand:+ start:6123 stop:7178 length:1056 start_codon:yes stop_codon:yes gene_type:complete
VNGIGEQMTWEQRWHPLREEWVLIASHRDERPWRGGSSAVNAEPIPSYVEDCYLCPGNERVSGATNQRYDSVYVFDNDHPSFSSEAPLELDEPARPYRNKPATGVARVVCYSPSHNTTLAELSLDEIVNVLQEWQHQQRELSALAAVNYVLIFENKGEVVGVSNPHPHCQVYATNFTFKQIDVELQSCRAYLTEHGRGLFPDIIKAEQQDGRRILAENGGAVSFVPYFARYAYETYVAPKQSHRFLSDLSAEELLDLAAVLKETLVCFDNLWQISFPYVMLLHQAPCDGNDYPFYHFHIQIQPPLRRPGLLKYLGGAEVGGGCFLNDTSPEEKARELQAVAGEHYRNVADS